MMDEEVMALAQVSAKLMDTLITAELPAKSAKLCAAFVRAFEAEGFSRAEALQLASNQMQNLGKGAS